MKTFTKSITFLVLLSVAVFASSTLYAADAGIKAGSLEIKTIEGTRHNLIIRSSVDIVAVFTDPEGNKEHYLGEMGYKLGVDFSHKTSEDLTYLVFSAASEYKTGSYALQGKYFGSKVSAQAGFGVGAQLLIGGFDKSFSLQPLAAGTTQGVGASIGLGYLYLQKDPHK
jgi:hypothetical protein